MLRSTVFLFFIFQKAVDFAERVSKLTDTFPKGNYYITDQFNRAALSISLNFVEGNGRWHKAYRRNFFYIAQGSCYECVPILELCYRKALADQRIHEILNQNLEEIAKMISGLIQGVEKRII